MLYKTRGIVFRFTKYGETSIIVNIFTEVFGLQSYIVNGVRSKSSRSKIALYQPLTILDLVVYYRENANINRIKEVKCLYPYQSLTVDIRRSALAMFLSEVMNKTIKEESHAQDLCNFLISSLITLDTLQGPVENFHLIFLLKLSRFLGFGAHQVQEILSGRATEDEIERLMTILVNATYDQPVRMSNTQRRIILDHFLNFYRNHIETLGELKSVAVLKDILT